MDLASGTHIPQEILSLIVEQLERDSELRTFRNLCLVSHGFCIDARRCLYSRIRITRKRLYCEPNRDFQAITVDEAIPLLTTIAHHNHSLGQLVREFHYSPENGSRPGAFWELVNQSLHYMFNLKVFRFHNFVSPSKRNLFWGTKFQLEEFYWNDGYDVDIDGELLRFLKTQPKLKVLAVPLSSDTVRWTLFPELRTFIGDAGSIKQIIPHHPVTKLRWRGFNSPDTTYKDTFAALTTLRVLSIEYSQAVSWVAIIAPHLKSLEILHMTGLRVCPLFSHLRITAITGNHQASSFDRVVKLIHPRVFMWSPLSKPIEVFGEEEQRRLLNGWFHEMKRLEAVYFPAMHDHTGKVGFLRWSPGLHLPVPVTSQELIERESMHEFASLLIDPYSLNFDGHFPIH